LFFNIVPFLENRSVSPQRGRCIIVLSTNTHGVEKIHQIQNASTYEFNVPPHAAVKMTDHPVQQ
jgi:hypothetical protein